MRARATKAWKNLGYSNKKESLQFIEILECLQNKREARPEHRSDSVKVMVGTVEETGRHARSPTKLKQAFAQKANTPLCVCVRASQGQHRGACLTPGR